MKNKSVVLLFLIVVVVTAAGFREKEAVTPYPFTAPRFFPEMPVNPANPVSKEGAALGRFLFYDPILSFDSSISCSSCHKQEFAFSDGGKSFSRGFGGKLTQRNSSALFNLAWYPSMFWDGRAETIEEQVFHPVRNHDEMNLEWKIAEKRIRRSSFYREQFRNIFGEVPIDSNLIAFAIAQFERTIISSHSKYDRVLNGTDYLSPDEKAGFVLVNDMTKGDCLHCHTTDGDALGTTGKFANNGLDTASSPLSYTDKGRGAITGNAGDNGKFKIPSLRNLAFTAPYMHDGRFPTLEAVVDFYNTGVHPGVNTDPKMEFARHGGMHLSCEEKEQIIAFLLTLSDSALVTDSAFSNPFPVKR